MNIQCERCGFKTSGSYPLTCVCGHVTGLQVKKQTMGVGSHLRKLIPKILETPGCNCKAVAAQWDRNGIEWAEANRNKMIDHLVSKAPRAAPLKRIVASRLVDTAIKRAKRDAGKG